MIRNIVEKMKYGFSTVEIPKDRFLQSFGFSEADIKNHGSEMCEAIIGEQNHCTNQLGEGIK